MLYVDESNESNERDNLLQYEEPSEIYTGATFVNTEDIKLNSNQHEGQPKNMSTSGSSRFDSDSSDGEDVAFDMSKYKS